MHLTNLAGVAYAHSQSVACDEEIMKNETKQLSAIFLYSKNLIK